MLAGFFSAKMKKYQVTWLPCEVEALSIATLKMAFKNITNLFVALIGQGNHDVWNMQSRNRFLGHFFENLFRFLQDIGPNASIKKMKTGCMVFTSQ